jgi:hypothetical protein
MDGRNARSLSKQKGRRGDPDKIPSFGTQPLSAGDDAASQGQQDNEFEAPQASGLVPCSELKGCEKFWGSTLIRGRVWSLRPTR